MKCTTVLLFSCISSLLGTVELSQWQQIYFSLPSVVDIIFPTNGCPPLINSQIEGRFCPSIHKKLYMYLSSSSLLSFASLYDGGNFVVTRYICEVIYCFVSLGFLAYNWICFCRAFAGVSKYCAKNHLSTAEDWQNRSIFTLEYFIAVVIFNLGLNFRRRRAYSFFLSGKTKLLLNRTTAYFKDGLSNYLNPNILTRWRRNEKKFLAET